MSDSSVMSLTNSRRRFERRTYTPLIVTTPGEGDTTNALTLASQVRALTISDTEFTQLQEKVSGEGQMTALRAMQGLATAVSASAVLSSAAGLGAASTADLREVSDALGAIRTQAANTLVSGVSDLHRRYTTQLATPQQSKPTEAANLPVPIAASLTPKATQFALASTSAMPAALDLRLRSAATASLTTAAPAVMAWAAVHATDQLQQIFGNAGAYLAMGSTPTATLANTLTHIARLQLLTELFSQSLTQLPLQPLGLLHLERLEMTPLAIERGELSYSLPLAPNEKVTLAHREWSVREQEFSEFIEDSLVNYSEQGVAQTDDIAMSTSTQTSHNDALSMNQPVAAANGVHVTSPVDTTKSASSSVDDTTTKDESKSQSRTVTALASTRTMRDHKISFTVTTVSGMEDFTAHLIENKHDDKSMRIDYFKRVRKWQSDLYRYGVRLTYDVVLPDPGAELRQREVELQSISAQLSTEFQLDLTASQIQVGNWEMLAGQYGVTLPAPPDQVRQIESTQQVNFPTPYDINTAGDGTKWQQVQRETSLNVAVSQGYELNNLNVFAQIFPWPEDLGAKWIEAYAGQSFNGANPDADGYCKLNWNVTPGQVPAQGQITVVFRMRAPENGVLRLTATIVPMESTMEQWRLTCWAIIRDAASAAAAQHRSYLRDRQAALQKQIAADDPIRLRRMEREAIMRAVLEWLFPGFDDASSVLNNLPSPDELDPGTWQQVMEYGEYIKFVQTAIDWDNVMVFLYPYFWDLPAHKQQKLFLDHPDPIHREFLRAGAARVIVAIQPGFEDQVVSLLDQGQLGNLGDQSRFSQVIKDVQDANAAYAKTTQGGGPTEDPEQPGILIGSWTDYTPTSALDIEVTVQPVITA